MDHQDDEGVEQDNPDNQEENVHNHNNTIDTLGFFQLILLDHFRNFQQLRFYRASANVFYRVVEYVVQHDHGMINFLVQFYIDYVQPYFQFRNLRHPALEHHVIRVGRNALRVLFMAMVRFVLRFWLMREFTMVDWYRNVAGDPARDVWRVIYATEHWIKVLDVTLVGTWVVAGVWCMLIVLGDFFLVTGLLGWWG